jgi:regulator of sigma D
MFINEKNKITVNLDDKIIRNNALKALLEFCFSFCDSVSFCQSNNKGMTKTESDKAIDEYNEYLKKHELYEGLTPSTQDMLTFFKEIAETDEEYNAMVQKEKEAREKFESNFLKSEDEVVSYINEYLKELTITSRYVTCMTLSTHGSPVIMYYCAINDYMKEKFYQMDDLFQPVIQNEEQGIVLDDPCFYDRGKIILSVCTHENYGTLFLDEVQYEEFKKLKI